MGRYSGEMRRLGPARWRDGDHLRVWFGGGDVAHPAENIHDRIEMATLEIR